MCVSYAYIRHTWNDTRGITVDSIEPRLQAKLFLINIWHLNNVCDYNKKKKWKKPLKELEPKRNSSRVYFVLKRQLNITALNRIHFTLCQTKIHDIDEKYAITLWNEVSYFGSEFPCILLKSISFVRHIPFNLSS